MKTKEPEFMRELHSIGAKLSREWGKMSDEEFLSHMHKIGKQFKESVSSRKDTALSPSR